MVEDVECFEAELELHLLMNREYLHKGHIQIRPSRPDQRITPGVSVGVLCWNAVGRRAEPIRQCLRVRNATCLIRTALRPRIGRRGSQDRCEVEPRLSKEDAVGLPSSQEPVNRPALVHELSAFAKRQHPQVAQRQALTLVNDGIAALR